MYTLLFEPAGFRLFKKLPRPIKAVISKHAERLKTEPLIGEPLKGKHRQFRSLHFSHQGVAYRIIYQVIEITKTVSVRLADKRENIYKRLEHME
jgi:mRNA-degrading endonuclease RelE of RelBE toxin-antitoxin system